MNQQSWQKSLVVIGCICVLYVVLNQLLMTAQLASDTSRARPDIIALNGQWQFYWDELLSPADFRGDARINGVNAATIAVPSSWTGQIVGATVNNGQPLPRFGVATYRLQTTIPASLTNKQMILLLASVGSAHQIWVNGVFQGGLGTVADVADGRLRTPETPAIRLRFVDVPAHTSQLDIIIQVSNYTFRDSGIFGDVMIGDSYTTMMFLLDRYVVRDLLLWSFIFLIGAYQITVYMTSRRDTSLLWLAGLCFAAALRSLFINKFLFDVLFPNISWDMVMRLQYSAKFITMLCYICLLYPAIRMMVPLRIHWICVAVSGLLVVYVWSTPVGAFTLTFWQQTVLMVVILMYYAVMSLRLVLQQHTLESKLNIASQVVVIVGVIYDYFLFTKRFESVQLVPIAILAMLLIQALVISLRYALFQQQNIQLTAELKEINRSLEVKVQERTEALNQSNAQLAALNNQRTQLMANIAHDMGSPIMGVQSSLHVLTDKSMADHERQDVVDMLHQRVRYLRQLIDGLFNLSMLESKQLEFDWEVLPVFDIYAEFNTYFGRLMHTQGRILHAEHIAMDGHDVHALVRIDRRQLHRVMHNLIDNAVKFSTNPNTPIEMTSMVRRVPHNPAGMREWYVEVVDYGIGIEPSQLPMIFQRFYSGNHAQHRGGSGLGLAIAKEIVERHGGTMSVHSEPGRGSTFAFVVPIVD